MVHQPCWYIARAGVNGFARSFYWLFLLISSRYQDPEQGHCYSVNEGHYLKFPQGVKQYIKYCQAVDEQEKRPYTSRYIGSLVADFHRNLLKGGIYMYPSGTNAPKGKLRLLYECNPIAFWQNRLAAKPLLAFSDPDLDPTELHQRTTVLRRFTFYGG